MTGAGRALCVGSFPGKDKGAQGDIIAYLGQVPVRVRGRVASGDILVPSTRHDGTAVAQESRAMLVIGLAISGNVPSECESDNGNTKGSGIVDMVDVMITPPSAQPQRDHKHQQQQQQQQQQRLQQEELHEKLLVDPVIAFVAHQQRRTNRLPKIARLVCTVSVAP
jgi:hypothetical protein